MSNSVSGVLEFSIVMPCLNEAETIESCIKKALNSLEKNKIIGEVIIADNGSTDNSIEIANRSGARVVQVSNKGYGAAISGGLNASNAKYSIIGDADGSYDFSNLEYFIEALRNGADLVMGNRFKGGIAKGAMPWKNRYIGNPILSRLGRLFFSTPIGDFHCGLRGISKKAFEEMNLKASGMEFASEMVAIASLGRMNVVEVPTTLSPDGRSRPPHLRPYRDALRHIICMFCIWWKSER